MRLIKEFKAISESYGATKYMSEEAYSECVLFVMEKFSQLSVFEIREAYRQWACGEIESKSGAMFHGVFNAANLGSILVAYEKKRKRIIAKYLSLSIERKERAIQHKAAVQKKEQFEKDFPLQIEAARKGFTEWQQVKPFWYNACLSRGYFKVEKEYANKVFELSKRLASNEVRAEIAGGVRYMTMKVLGQEDTMADRAKAIARKLVVWQKVLGRDLPILEA